MTDKEESDAQLACDGIAYNHANAWQLGLLDTQHDDVRQLAAYALSEGPQLANELQLCNVPHGFAEMRGRLGIPDHRYDAEHTNDTICLTERSTERGVR
ncbi:MAG TPA: hypothetical protein VJO52_03415 [Gemmatimonadaceae bacterium]|nr:hypothetical protein [Gemmatimonadaceae bacterium]